MKIVSTLENYVVNGVWLSIKDEVEILEEDLEKYIHLAGVQIVTEKEDIEKDLKTELQSEETNIESNI